MITLFLNIKTSLWRSFEDYWLSKYIVHIVEIANLFCSDLTTATSGISFAANKSEQKNQQFSTICTKHLESCEAMTSSTHSFAYSYQCFKKCFVKISETSKFHNFLIFSSDFNKISLLCLQMFTLSIEINFKPVRISRLS